MPLILLIRRAFFFNVFYLMYEDLLNSSVGNLALEQPCRMAFGKMAFGNNVGKGENAHSQHFLLFPQCFYHCDLHLICCMQML